MKSYSKALEIRRKAEELLENRGSKTVKQLSEADLHELIHEYEVHQIELELMNEELLRKDVTLNESENKYRIIFNNIQDVYYRIDLDGIIVDISPSITQLGGYNRADMIGKEVSEYYYSDKDRELFLNTIKQTQIVNDYELRFKNNQGGVIYTSVNAHIGFDNTGKAAYIEGILRDISERKLAEERLKESEEKYRELVENSPDSIAIYEEGKFVYANNVLVQLLAAKNSDELIGKPVLDFIHPDSITLVVERMKKVATDGIILPFVEEKIISLDGSTIDVEIKAIPINLGNKQAVQLIIHNLTESKIEEARLKKSEEKYRTIFNNVQDVFYQNDINGIIKEISPSIKYFTEFDREELIGSNASALYYDSKARENFLEKLFKEKDVRDFEFRIKTKTDELKYVSINARLIYDINGNPDHIDGSLRDITQRKLVEDSFRKSEALLRSIAETTTDVIFVKDRACRFVFINPAGCKFNGKTQEQLIGKSKADFNPNPVEVAQFNADDMRIMDSGNSESYEETIKAADGITRTYLTTKVPRYDGQGAIIGLIGVAHDITERKQAEELLIQTRQNYETFFNTINDFLFILDEQGNIIHTNKTVINRLGYTMEELLGNSVLNVHPAERREEAGRIVGEMLSGTSEFCPVPLITKSGVQIPVETRISLGIWNNKPAIFGVTKDISQLRLSEEKFSKVFYLNPSACGLSDLATGKYIEVNEAFYTLFGFDKNEVIGKTAMELGILASDVRTEILSKTEDGGSVPYSEAILKSKNGTTIYAVLSAENIYIQDKEYRYTVVHDITERKLTEEKLKESEKRYRNLFENAQEGIFQTNVDGSYVSVNPSLAKMYGFDTPEEMIKTRIDIAKDAYSDAGERERFLRIIEEQGFVKGYEYEVKRKDGSKIWYYEDAVAIKDETGKTKYFEGFVIDITQRKQAEEKLKESQSKYFNLYTLMRLMSDTMPDMLWAKDLNSRFIFANKAVCENLLNATDTSEPIGKDDYFFAKRERGLHPKDVNWHTFGELCVDSDEITKKEMKLMHFDEYGNVKGKFLYLDVHKAPLFNDKNEFIGLVGSGRDVTESKLTEQELIKAKERAEASDRLKTAFLNNISHEIRTPLNGILGFASLIIEPDLTEKQKNEYLKILNNSGYRLIKTVSDYMDISLITSGNMDIHNTNFTINDLFDKLLKEHKQNYEDSDLSLKIQLSEEIKTIELVLDESLLINALVHLLDNAIKFTKEGEITLGAEIKGKHIVFFVKDTGKGITKEAQEIIFNVFMQENVSNIRGYEGSGLGLSIVKGIMNLLGGTVSLDSEINKGSIFYLSLPFASPVKTDVLTNKLVVLIAEDDEVSAELISAKIKKISKEIIILINGKDVVEECRNNPDINLILMDVKMPGLNGYEASEQIRQFNKDVIIIAQTAFGMHGDYEKAIMMGCNEYITKPIDFVLLMALINKYFCK